MQTVKINKNEADQRLDRFLAKFLDKASKSLIQKYIRTKKIKVNKKRASPDLVLKEGDQINIYIYDEVLNQYQSQKTYRVYEDSLDYIYEDNNISIIYKPSGMLMYGQDKSLVDLYISDLIKKKEFNPNHELSFTPSLANRLDRNTKGLVIGCKNAETLREINGLIKSRKLEKRYICLVNGIIDSKVELRNKLLIKDKDLVMISKDRGKEAISVFYPLKTSKSYSLVEADLVTGRKHQLRVHLASLNNPIVGDSKYGKGEDLRAFDEYGQYLIAYKLKFNELEGTLAYLSKKEFSLDRAYRNLELESYYLNL